MDRLPLEKDDEDEDDEDLDLEPLRLLRELPMRIFWVPDDEEMKQREHLLFFRSFSRGGKQVVRGGGLLVFLARVEICLFFHVMGCRLGGGGGRGVWGVRGVRGRTGAARGRKKEVQNKNKQNKNSLIYKFHGTRHSALSASSIINQ